MSKLLVAIGTVLCCGAFATFGIAAGLEADMVGMIALPLAFLGFFLVVAGRLLAD